MALDQWMAHAADHGVAGQELHHFFGVGHVAFHAQGQGFDALQNQPRAVRAQAGAKVAQAFAPRAQQEGAHGAFFAEHHVVKAFVALGELGELAAFFPVKTAAVHHDAANHRAVAAQEFGGGVVDQISAQLERFDEVRRGEGGVDQ